MKSVKVNVIIHPDTIQVKQFINLFFRNLGLDYQQTFRLKPSVFISEVCHVIVHYHVTNVEERRRGPGPKCETERTGAPPFCSGLVEDPTLNRKGGLRFSLSHTWDRALSSVPRRLSRDSELSRDKLH